MSFLMASALKTWPKFSKLAMKWPIWQPCSGVWWYFYWVYAVYDITIGRHIHVCMQRLAKFVDTTCVSRDAGAAVGQWKQ